MLVEPILALLDVHLPIVEQLALSITTLQVSSENLDVPRIRSASEAVGLPPAEPIGAFSTSEHEKSRHLVFILIPERLSCLYELLLLPLVLNVSQTRVVEARNAG